MACDPCHRFRICFPYSVPEWRYCAETVYIRNFWIGKSVMHHRQCTTCGQQNWQISLWASPKSPRHTFRVTRPQKHCACIFRLLGNFSLPVMSLAEVPLAVSIVCDSLPILHVPLYEEQHGACRPSLPPSLLPLLVLKTLWVHWGNRARWGERRWV